MPLKESSQSMTEIAIPNGQNFSSCYMELCKRQRLRPLPIICVTLPHYLDFTTDRVKMDDWSPILNALSLDRTLKSIGIRSRYQYRKPLEEVNSEVKARAIGKAPVVLTRFLLEWLSHSVAQCIRNSPVLTSLELEGIPLPPDCLAVLCVGLTNTQTLRHLSLFKCYIGDANCELVCRTIADVKSIRSLNLGQCDLTPHCGPALAAALSRQKLLLFHDTWKQSLRYREPNLDAMPGLRRLTLNGNSRLGDSAVSEIIEAVGDSLWLKALDLQHCGLTDVVTNEILELLDHNKTLVVVDVRLNLNLRDDLAEEIAKKLEENNPSGKSEYRWISVPKKDLTKASKRNDHNDDPLIIKAKNKRIKDFRPPSHPRTAPSRITPDERGKVRQPSSRSVELPKSKPSPSVAKQPLHLNLRAQMEPCDGLFNNLASGESKKMEKHQEMVKEDKDEDTEMKIVEIVDQNSFEKDKNSPTDKDLEDLLRQLAEARAQHERLLEETKRNDLLLTEERVRREMAETKLRSLKNDLAELENALKEKEQETRGFLLVSQNSLDEICTSFDNLLDMLDSVSRNRSVRSESEDESIIKADIRTRMALLIRKTKSESLRRGYFTEEVSKDVKKFARSEADMRNSLPPINMIHLERHIGDSPDIVSPSLEENFRKREDSFRQIGDSCRQIEDSCRQIGDSCRRREDSFRQLGDSFRKKDSFRQMGDSFREKDDSYRKIEDSFRKMEDTNRVAVPSSATERARAIFAQIVNGNMILNLGSQ